MEGAGLSAHIGKLPNPSKAGLGNSLKDNGLAGTSQNLQPLQGRGGGLQNMVNHIFDLLRVILLYACTSLPTPLDPIISSPMIVQYLSRKIQGETRTLTILIVFT